MVARLVRISSKRRKILRKFYSLSMVAWGKTSKKSLNTKLQQMPTEILVKIASKLPITKILQCRQALSNNNHKLDNIFFDPIFPSLVQSHINNNYNYSSKNTTFVAYNGVDYYSCTLIDYSTPDHVVTEFRLFDNSDSLRLDDTRTTIFRKVVDSCNGFVLIYWLSQNNSSRFSYSPSLWLMNPMTRRRLVLHESPLAHEWQDIKYGLGYGSKTGLLKVVRLYHRHRHDKITAEVTTVRDEGDCVWEVVNKEWSIGVKSIRSKAVVLNGVLHWLAYDNLILKFDIDQQKFEFIPSPYTTKNKQDPKRVIVSHLGVLDGLLCVGSTNDDKGVEIWVMKEYGIEKSWTRFTVIDGLDINEQFVLTPEIKDGKMILLTTLSRNQGTKDFAKDFFVDIYDPKLRKRVKRMPLCEGVDEKVRAARMTVDYFVPSFF